MALNFDIRDPKNQKLVITYLIPVIGLAAFFNFMVKPKIAEVQAVKSEVATLQSRVSGTMRALSSVEELEARKTALEAKLAELRSLVPDEENVAVLLEQFSRVERDAKVYLVGFDAAAVIEGEGRPYRENRYRVTLDAGYHQFATFMAEVMALPRLFSFSDLRIERNDTTEDTEVEYEGLEDQPRYLRIECTLTSYIYQKAADDAS